MNRSNRCGAELTVLLVQSQLPEPSQHCSLSWPPTQRGQRILAGLCCSCFVRGNTGFAMGLNAWQLGLGARLNEGGIWEL